MVLLRPMLASNGIVAAKCILPLATKYCSLQLDIGVSYDAAIVAASVNLMTAKQSKPKKETSTFRKCLKQLQSQKIKSTENF